MGNAKSKWLLVLTMIVGILLCGCAKDSNYTVYVERPNGKVDTLCCFYRTYSDTKDDVGFSGEYIRAYYHDSTYVRFWMVREWNPLRLQYGKH